MTSSFASRLTRAPHHAYIESAVLIAALSMLGACSKQQPPVAAHAEEASSATIAASMPDVPAGSYTIDKAHTSLLFRVDHLGFSHFTARFNRVDAQLEFDPANPAASTLAVQVDATSIETHYPDPAALDFNAQLQGPDWLNAQEFPQITYRSTSVDATGPRTMKIHGELTLRGVSRPVDLEATFNGGYAGHPMDPHARIGFSAHGSLKRSEFGMTYGIPAAGTSMGVGDEVDVIVETEFSGPAWQQAATAQ